MSDPSRLNPAEPPRRHPASFLLAWLDAPAVRGSLPLIVMLAALGLGAADVIVKRQSKVAIAEQTWGFYTITGFVIVVAAVLAAWPLRTLLSRSEDFYPARRRRGGAADASAKERGDV